jgi:hypothetical protein
VAVFLKLHGLVHNSSNLQEAEKYVKILTTTLTAHVATESLTSWKLVQVCTNILIGSTFSEIHLRWHYLTVFSRMSVFNRHTKNDKWSHSRMSSYDRQIFFRVSLVVCLSYVAAGLCSYGKALLNSLSGICCHLAHIIWTQKEKSHDLAAWTCCVKKGLNPLHVLAAENSENHYNW